MIQYISGYAKKNIRILYRIPYTVPLETMGPFARGKTLSLPNVSFSVFGTCSIFFVTLQGIIAEQQKFFHSCSCFLYHAVK